MKEEEEEIHKKVPAITLKKNSKVKKMQKKCKITHFPKKDFIMQKNLNNAAKNRKKN